MENRNDSCSVTVILACWILGAGLVCYGVFIFLSNAISGYMVIP